MASIKKRGENLYIRYMIDGKEKTKATGLKDTQKNREFIKLQVIPKLMEKIESLKVSKKDTVSDLAKKYLDEKANLKTFSEYEARVTNHILPFFGKRQISDIALDEIKDWIDKFDISPKTLKNYVMDFRMIFQLGIEHRFINENLFDYIRLKKHIKKDIQPFTKKDLLCVLKESSGSLNNFFGIAFYTGMRSGEIVALKVDDINMDKNFIYVRRNIQKGAVTTPKTENSIRQIPILNLCKKYLLSQIEIANKKGTQWLFSNSKGEYLYNADSLNARRFLRELGIQNRVHDMRHTFITNMLDSNSIKLTDLARIVGHSNTQMILTVYAKWIKSENINIDLNINIYDEKSA